MPEQSMTSTRVQTGAQDKSQSNAASSEPAGDPCVLVIFGASAISPNAC